MKSNGKGRLWSWIVALALAAFCLWWSLRGVEWRAVWTTISGAQLRLLAASSAFMGVSFFVRAVRWRILLNAEEKLSLGDVFCATMAGYMGNTFLPARAGEVIRTLVISGRSSLTKTYVLTTALSERLMDVITLVLWSSIILIGVHPKPDWMAGAARILAAGSGLGALAIAVLPYTGGLVQNLLRRLPLPHGLRDRLIELAEQVLLGMRAFHHPGRFLGFAALTVLIWISDGLGTMLAGHSLHLDLSFSMSMLLITGLGLGSALPSTPGYVGIFQFVAVTVLVPLGISKSNALAFILVVQAYGYFSTALIGLPCLWILRRSKEVETVSA